MKRRALTFILALLLILSACGGALQTADEFLAWQEQYDLGVRYLSEGNYEEAILAFSAAIEIDPKQAPAYVGRGDAYFAMGDYFNAEKDYNCALEVDPSLDLFDRFSALEDAFHTDLSETDLSESEDLEDSLLGQVTGTLSLSNFRYSYTDGGEIITWKGNEDAVGGLYLSFDVDGPSNVADVWIWTWSTEGFTSEEIDMHIEEAVSAWANEGPIHSRGSLPFHIAGNGHPVYPNEKGKEQEILLIGLDTEMNAVGYAIATASIP